ncbi:MAG: hypothetical protein LBE35_05590 [Clostridiales bacterium]|jgi:hypothetical protein|nr:hypothetical protein [Clostridiales bacterium]
MRKERLKGMVFGIIVTLTLVFAVPAIANTITTTIQVTYRGLCISVNGQTVVPEQEPFIFNGRTFLALRDVAEALGAEVRMNEITNVIEITTVAGITPTVPPATTVPPETLPAGVSATNRNQRPTNPAITREQAEDIAVQWLRGQGITDTRRDGSVVMDFERGRWIWELEHQNRTYEWDFYIDVMTGEIVHTERDRR